MGGIAWAAAYPVNSPCQSIQGSTGRSHRWGCRSRCWHRSRAGHSPAQSALQHTLWAQDSLAPALPPVPLRPPSTAAAPPEVLGHGPGGPREGPGMAPGWPRGSQIWVGTAHLYSPIVLLHLHLNEFPSWAHRCIPLETQLRIPFEGTDRQSR